MAGIEGRSIHCLQEPPHEYGRELWDLERATRVRNGILRDCGPEFAGKRSGLARRVLVGTRIPIAKEGDRRLDAGRMHLLARSRVTIVRRAEFGDAGIE
jgi:hypothetical protein